MGININDEMPSDVMQQIKDMKDTADKLKDTA